MWLITILLAILVALIIIIIMDTSMKLALMITTLYNYDTKKLFIPATLTVALWGLLFVGCYNTINKSLGNDTIDLVFSMIFDHSLIPMYLPNILKPILSTCLVGTLLQSLTYYTVNINYQKVTGVVRFSLKRSLNSIVDIFFNKVLKKERRRSAKNKALSEVTIQPKKLTFIRAIITSVISVIITLSVCIALFLIGELISGKVLTKL